MKDASKSYDFSAKVWLYSSAKASWHFVDVPQEISDQIRYNWKAKKAAWGSVRITAKIGKTEWQTSIFYQKSSGCYLLPLKAQIRKQENISAGKKIKVSILL